MFVIDELVQLCVDADLKFVIVNGVITGLKKPSETDGMVETDNSSELLGYYRYLCRQKNAGKTENDDEGVDLKSYINFLRFSKMHLHSIPLYMQVNSLAPARIENDITMVRILSHVSLIESSSIVQTNTDIKSIRRRIIEHIKKFNLMARFPFESIDITNYKIKAMKFSDERAKQISSNLRICGFCHKGGKKAIQNNGFDIQFDVNIIKTFLMTVLSFPNQNDKYALLLGKQVRSKLVRVFDLIYYNDEKIKFHPAVFKDTLSLITSQGSFPVGLLMANYSTTNQIKLSDFIYQEHLNIGFYMLTCFVNLGYNVVFHFPKVGQEVAVMFDYEITLAEYIRIHFENCSHFSFSSEFKNSITISDNIANIPQPKKEDIKLPELYNYKMPMPTTFKK
uniref:DNA-directed DNA polymerase n=1 Tax=Rhabditophanes sp. KR3021 TaxID=114890 RepID=A0AC35U697_9BILA